MSARRSLLCVALIAVMGMIAAGCDWTMAGYDAANTKFNPEKNLTPGNVGGIYRHWVANVQGAKSSRSTPAVTTIDNTKYVFVQTANGYLEKRRASDGASIWAIWDGNAGSGNWGTSTSSPAIVTPKGTSQTQVVVGSMDGHVYSFDARGGGELWQFPTGASDFAPVVSSPVITPGGNVIVTMGEKIGTPGYFGQRTFYAIWRFDPRNGQENGIWGLGSTINSGGYEASSVAVDPANGMVFAGMPGFDPDYISNQSGVLALYNADGSFQGAWQSTWNNSYVGVSAAPAVAGGRVFVMSTTGLRELNEANGGVMYGPTGANSQFSSPAVAGDTVYVGTDNGYTKGFLVNGLTPRWTSGQNVDAYGSPVRGASPVITGQSYPTLDRYLVFNSFGNGDVKAFDADALGTTSAIWTRQDHGTGKGGLAVSGGVIYVQGDDGQLRAFGL